MNATDLQVGLDPTAFTQITGAQLAQLVNSATTNDDRGMVLVTTDGGDGSPNVPNASATGNENWQRYLWIRISATFVTVYVWNPAAGTNATYLNWVTITSASYAPNSIPGYALITGSVPASALGPIPYSQLTGTPAYAALNIALTALLSDGILTSQLFSASTFVWGDLQGSGSSPGTPVIKAGAVTAAKIGTQSVAGNATLLAGNIIDRSIKGIQLSSANPTHGMADSTNSLTNSGVIPQVINSVDLFNNISVPSLSVPAQTYSSNFTTWSAVAAGDVVVVNNAKDGYVTNSRKIITLPEPVPTTDDGKVITVKSDASGDYQLLALSTTGKLLQTQVVRSIVSSFLAGGATTTQIILTAAPAVRISAGAIVNVSTKTGWLLDGTTLGSTKVPLSLQFTPTNTAAFMKITLRLQINNQGNSSVVAALYQMPNANITSIISGVVIYQGTAGSPTDINPMTDATSGACVASRYESASGSSMEHEFSWIIKPTGYTAGTVINIIPAIGTSDASAVGVNSTSTSAATPVFAAGYCAATLEVQEILA